MSRGTSCHHLVIARRELLGIALCSAALIGCSGSPIQMRYRLAVELETPQGLRRGSSVVEVTKVEGSGIPDTAVRSSFRGEAVALELPGGTLFALLSSMEDADYGADLPTRVILPRTPKTVPRQSWRERVLLVQATKGVIDVPERLWPMFVTFADIREPTSVRRVYPEIMAPEFGQGYRIRRVTIEMTDAEITVGIRRLLPWLDAYAGKHLDGTTSAFNDLTHDRIAGRLSPGYFSANTRDKP